VREHDSKIVGNGGQDAAPKAYPFE